MKTLIFFLIASLALLALSGCVSPVHTSLDINKTDAEFDLNYRSEKDVVAEKRTTVTAVDGTVTEEFITIRSEASSAARAQAEREAVNAETRQAPAEAVSELVRRIPAAPAL